MGWLRSGSNNVVLKMWRSDVVGVVRWGRARRERAGWECGGGGVGRLVGGGDREWTAGSGRPACSRDGRRISADNDAGIAFTAS